MVDALPSRRELLQGFISALVLTISHRATYAMGAPGDAATMTAVWDAIADGLVPLDPKIPSDALDEIADGIIDELSRTAPAALDSFTEALQNHRLDRAGATAALSGLERTDAFATVWATTIRHVFRHPSVWATVGYQGSSIEYGGYLERGFNDIDWLK